MWLTLQLSHSEVLGLGGVASRWSRVIPQQPACFLFASVEVATFYTRGIRLKFHTPSVTIENHAGEWAGILRPHRSSDISENVRPKMQPLELVAISLGTARNSEPEEPG